MGEYLLCFVLIPNHWLPFVGGEGGNNLCHLEKKTFSVYSSEKHDTVNTCVVITEFFLVA